jgi:hypothetical protein
MPLSICKKLNDTLTKSEMHIIQLYKTELKVIGELKDVMISISSNPKFHQVINIIIVDIPEAYGMLLIRDWYKTLHGYFSIDWSNLWLPLKGNPNMIKINREKYLKHTITNLESHNEPSPNEFPVLENYSCESDFGNLSPCLSEVLVSKRS